MATLGMAEPAVTMSEAQAYVRIETGEEEAVLAGLIRTASALCESFLNQIVIAREFVTELPASGGWERLAPSPARAITSVEGVDANGVTTSLQSGDYSIDIDSSGDGTTLLPEPSTWWSFHRWRTGRRTEGRSHCRAVRRGDHRHGGESGRFANS